MKGFKDKNNKFHPIRGYKGVRKSDRKKKDIVEPFPVGKSQTIPRGKLIQMQREAGVRGKHDESQMMAMPIDMSVREQMEWENVVDSEIVKVKHETMDGRPITSVRFANGEEWFEFDSVDHQEDFLKENNIKVDEEVTGEFVEVNHPMISGYITMPSGKVAFGEKEDTRMKKDEEEIEEEMPDLFVSNPVMDEKLEKQFQKWEERGEKKKGETRKARLVHKDFFENKTGRLECRHCGHLTSREWSDLGCDCQIEEDE